MADVPVTIVLSAKADSTSVRAACERLGLSELRWLPNLRILTGQINPAALAAIAAIDGIRSVERAGLITLPRPDSPIQ